MKTAASPQVKALQTELRRPTRFRWFVLLFMFLFYLINHAVRANIGVILPYIKKEFLLTNVRAGALASFFFLGYTLTQERIGHERDRSGMAGTIMQKRRS